MTTCKSLLRKEAGKNKDKEEAGKRSIIMDKKFKHHSLIDKIYKRLNLHIAFEKVKANKGAGGVDRETIEEFGQNLPERIEETHRLLYEDRYEFRPVRRVCIPKANGGKRWLGIPTIRDRVVQQAILNRIERIFEPKFKDCSYGFRPNRSPLSAVKKVEEYLEQGYQWIVEVDIENFFDTINHEKLIDQVAEEIADGKVLSLIRKILKSGAMEEMKEKYLTTGTPQGGVISPLLANIYLHPYDDKMTKEGFQMIRYADDILIMCKTQAEAQRALQRTKQILEKELELRLNSEKTRIRHKRKAFEFLGYLFGHGSTDYKIPRKRAIEGFKNKIRRITRRQQPKKIEEIIRELNPVIRGWRNYFIYGNCRKIFWNLDCWVENRLRVFKVKTWGLRTHLKMPHELFEKLGLLTLNQTFYPTNYQNFLPPAKGQ